MLQLKNIRKTYDLGDQSVEALRGVDISFRESEFVSVLGPSGCGKTTLLNIIGGLDQYTDGDLVINGVSTKTYKDADWDSYRNHSIGFVFQSYNLIPHQSVLSNVELALTLNGISKSERRRRAKEVLARVGLADQIKKRPNQLSGGQMQRVAIARALINNPDILLADEPTGALDSETSTQIMELLREISGDKLIIMVTHNAELAEQYSSRIITLLDGKVTGDSLPFDGSEETVENHVTKKTGMSTWTALALSMNNLMTKKARTFLTAFAGSIGIIGIALILSLSTGVQNYINDVQEDTLSSYPLTIEHETVDISSLMSAMAENHPENQSAEPHENDAVYSNVSMLNLLNSMMHLDTNYNNLGGLKEFMESEESGMSEYASAITYSYDTDLYVFAGDTSEKVYQVNPSTVFDSVMPSTATTATGETVNVSDQMNAYNSIFGTSSSMQLWQEIIPASDGTGISALIYDQYDLVYGHWPEKYNEVVLVLDERNEISEVVLYSLGMKDNGKIPEYMNALMKGEDVTAESERIEYSVFRDLDLRLVLPTDFYQYDAAGSRWVDMRGNETYMKYVIDKSEPIHISGIIRPNEDAVSTAITGAIGYISDLTAYYVEAINSSKIVEQQLDDPTVDVISGLPFDDGSLDSMTDADKAKDILAHLAGLSDSDRSAIYTAVMSVPSEEMLAQSVAQYLSQFPDRASMEAVMAQTYAEQAGMDAEAITEYLSGMTDEEVMQAMQGFAAAAISAQYAQQTQESLAMLTDAQKSMMLDGWLMEADEVTLAEMYEEYMPPVFSDMTFDEVKRRLGVVDIDSPSAISIYAATFENKDEITAIIARYNDSVDDADRITYTDYVAIIMSSITTIINAITYVLIAFVAISLVVSSIMIGIITYISVLERTKEIGILRAIGASKKDISRVFNAETLIVGFISGFIGISSTVLLCFPINAIIRHFSGIQSLGAELPVAGAVALLLISMLLTFIAGLIPSRIAARKDPVVALRTE